MRTLAIGDIHGCLTALETLADVAGFDEDDTIITLGDYVDRGPDSRGVIDFLLDLRKRCRLIHLRGNHEVMMVTARDSWWAARSWLGVGGRETLASYGSGFADVPDEHWQFIESAGRFHEMKTHFFVHANVDPDVPLEAQEDDVIYWESFNRPAPHRSGKIMVCGHTAQKTGLPANIGHAVCVDTWVYGEGWLTCLDVAVGTFWQANQAGEKRQGNIAANREA